MSVHLLGHQHAHRQSPVHRLPAALKLGVALAAIVGTVLAPLDFTGWFLGVAALLLAAIVLSGISPWFLFKRLLVLSPFVLGVALVNALQPAARAGLQGVPERVGL